MMELSDALGRVLRRSIRRAAAKLAPENALCYLNKGLLAFQSRQDTESAIAMAKKALEVDERCDIAYAHLAQMYLQQENQLGAIDCYDKGACRHWEKGGAEGWGPGED